MNPLALGPALMGVGRAVGPWAVRAFGAASWASIGWTLSDVADWFGADATPSPDGTGGSPAAAASQKMLGFGLVAGALLLFAFTALRKRK